MKTKAVKRLLSLLIAVITICAISAGAMADASSVSVTVRQGDTLLRICQANGIDYYKNKEAIKRLNGFTDDKQLDRIRVGSVIHIPSGAPISNGMPAVSGISVVPQAVYSVQQPSFSTAIVAGNAANIPFGDTVAYYITAYVIQSGDILNNLYNSWGMKLSSYSNIIKSLNGISDLNRLAVGNVLLLPVNRADIISGASYTVMTHTVVSGDTAYGICRSYGLDYGNAKATLQIFNPGINFDRILIGQRIYVPVNGVAGASAMPAATTQASLPTAATQQYSAQQYAAAALAAQQAQQLQLAEQQAQAAAQQKSLPVIGSVYDGYAVVVDYGSLLHLRLETTGTDVYLHLTPTVLGGYFPRIGDYVKCTFTSSDNILSYIKYGYNVFTR